MLELIIFERVQGHNAEKLEELEKESTALGKEVAEIKGQLDRLAALVSKK